MKIGEIWKSKQSIKFPNNTDITVRLIKYLGSDWWSCEVLIPADFDMYIELSGATLFKEAIKIGEAE